MTAVELDLLQQIKIAARNYLPHIHELGSRRQLNNSLGQMELNMSKAYAFFDTYMDVLTQRHTPELGALLAGCDVLAWDAMRKEHPALEIIEPPLVYCDRGFGASILREGVSLPNLIPNPLPLIQIPYSRLREKYNLTSIVHEAGHEVMMRLGLISSLPKAIQHALAKTSAARNLRHLWAQWMFELGPDFWTFCQTGLAQTAGIRDILSLPAGRVFHLSWTDPHPPPYLRVLISMEWCRQVWGRGDWDQWEEEWLALYPLKPRSNASHALLLRAKALLPLISRVMFNTRFHVLNGRRIPDLFDLTALAPSELERLAATSTRGSIHLKNLSPSMQLAVFRLIRDRGGVGEEKLDRIMSQWLIHLAQQRKNHSLESMK
ncbi:MAG: hypothetical protein ACOX5R_06430 [bacterium]